jgi:hypothetical protein
MLRRLAVSAVVGALMMGTVAPAALAGPDTDATISGKVTTGHGEAPGYVSVTVWDAATNEFRGQAYADNAGKYSVGRLSTSSSSNYKVKFESVGGEQWAHRKRSFEEAEIVTVAPGRQAVVDEQLFEVPGGTLTFTATDTDTGQRFQSFCADVSGSGFARRGCTETGLITMHEVPPAEYYVFANGDDFHLGDDQKATVVLDQTTAVDFRMAPAGVFELTVTDAVTNAPVANACIKAYDGVGGFGLGNGPSCTGADGRFRMPSTRPGTYRMYVDARDGKHGSQWVGPHGGTGLPALAKTFRIGGGQTVSVAARLDGGGSIGGTVVDKVSGAPVEGVCAFSHAGYTEGDRTPNCSDKDGKYVIGNLGPYLWPVEFVDNLGRYSYQWSGDQPTQLTARLIKVRTGQPATEDARLVTGGTSLKGRITAADGRQLQGSVTGYNAITGDNVGDYVFLDENGNYEIPRIAGTQPVKVRYYDSFVTGPTVWYRNSPSFDRATSVLVRSGTPVSGIDIQVP